jgi:hypothetical protein
VQVEAIRQFMGVMAELEANPRGGTHAGQHRAPYGVGGLYHAAIDVSLGLAPQVNNLCTANVDKKPNIRYTAKIH